MYTIPGCTINDKIYESAASILYRGVQNTDNTPIILKILKEDYPSRDELVRYRQEFEITHTLDMQGVIKAYGLETYGNTLAIILEDFGGESLRIHKERRKFPLGEALRLAIELTNILGGIHEANVIHKDINPSNIVYNPRTNQLKIIDFGISSKLSQEIPELKNPERLEGTLAYMSPEQTGRMNRALDYRTDFYALGVTLYELFTGQLPFTTQDPMELTHCHLARAPAPLRDFDEKISDNLSQVVLKLLAKRADDRYQTAQGLVTDLEFCRKELDQKVSNVIFTPGSRDVSAHLHLPQTLYGRERELATLLDTVERTSRGRTEALFVAGYSGVGKSALVKELHKTLIQPEGRSGYFMAGKFHQYHREIPYLAAREAFRDLIRQLLTESEERLSRWKKNLLEALGANGQIMTDFLPDLKLIIGEQPPVPKLDADSNRNRFKIELRKLGQVFLRREHPIVLFLDDLQWADAASLNLMKIFTGGSQFLLLIGSYRDNEVGPNHPLLMTIEEMEKAGTNVNMITLPPLELPDVRRYIADASRRKLEDTSELADLIKHKTAGNPFFMGEFLKTMQRENLLVFDAAQSHWSWDMARVQEQNITDNVVELIAERVSELAPDTKAVLKKAACLGNAFDLATLAVLHEKTPAETAGDLWGALELNMILPLRDEYKVAALEPLGISLHDEKSLFIYRFAHDRIAEASYNLLSVHEKQTLHLKAGRLLLSKFSENDHAGQIFTLVDHLNLGRNLFEDQNERDEAARLNLNAGSRARASTAYEPALGYYKTGLELLGAVNKKAWERNYELTFDLTIRAAEAALLANKFDEMEVFSKEALSWARDYMDQAKVYELQIQAHIARNNLGAAVELALASLKKLGIHIPNKGNTFRTLLGLLRIKLKLAGKSSDTILQLPEMTDEKALACSRLMGKASTAAYFNQPALLPLLVFEQINLSFKMGNTHITASNYIALGIILSGYLADVDGGYKYGMLGMRMMEYLEIFDSRPRIILLFHYFLRPWKKPLRESVPQLREAYKLSLEFGDLEYASLALITSGYASFCSGMDLGKLEKELNLHARTVIELGQENAQTYLDIDLQAIRRLRGAVDAEAAGQETLTKLLEAQDKTTLYTFFFWKLALACILQEPPDRRVRFADEAKKYADAGRGSPTLPLFHFYDSLARLSLFPNASKSERKRILKRVQTNQKKLKKWAHFAPMNQLHRFQLVEAESAHMLGHDLLARKLYETAIATARENNFKNDEALAWELAGYFYEAKGLTDFAHFSIKNAHYTYARWGADGKTAQLETSFSEILKTNPGTRDTTDTGSTIGHSDSSSLDLATIIKASQAISGEIVLDTLLHNMMRLLVENAGAEKGFFLVEKAGSLFLEAQEEVSPQGGYLNLEPVRAPLIRDESKLPLSLLDFTIRTEQVLVLAHACEEGDFTGSEYIRSNKTLSVLCVPVRKQGRVIGLLYLENNLTPGAFTAEHVKVIEILSAQIDLSIENARLYGNLEVKVQERTEQLESALGDVQALKDRQDGDYFLTSILLKPLCENTATDKRILSDILIKQYKQFKYQKWEAEIGGDMCACHDLTLRGKTYTLFMNADAMGKSMQGAGGSLVLLAALKALLGKINSSPALQDQSPETWLASAYEELSQLFATFNGFMQSTLIMGLADGESNRLFFLNAEHPLPVLYRNGQAEYFGQMTTAHKLGDMQNDPKLIIETLDLKAGDIIIMGSDGKDDLQIGLDAEGHRVIRANRNVFLECVVEAKGEPEQIMEALLRRGEFIDDFSLLRLRVS